MSALTSLTFALLITFISGEVAKHFRYPRIIGQLLGSLVLAIPLLKSLVFTAQSSGILETLSTIGVILLLFLTGLDLNLQELRKSGREAFVISIAGALVPFGLGFLTGKFLGFPSVTSFVLGVCLSITAEGTTVALLLEMKKMKSRVGSIMIGAGILDDIFEVLFLALVIFFARTGESPLVDFPEKAGLFLVAILLSFFLIPKIVHKVELEKDEVNLFTASILFCLFLAVVSEYSGMGAVFGAFIAGIIIQRSFIERRNQEEDEWVLRMFAFSFLVPFFFVNIGSHFEYTTVLDTLPLVLIVLIVALVGKIGGVLITKPLVDLSWKQLLLVGWGMNSRGVMELVIANIALTHGLISAELYGSIVVMAVLTTLLFPVIMRNMLYNDPKLLD